MEDFDQQYPYQNIIDVNRVLLCKSIIPERYLQSLRECNALSQEDCDDIINHYVHQTGQQRAGRFLEILYTKGPSAYDNFLTILEFENASLFEQLTGKKAKKPSPEFMDEIKSSSRGSIIIPHLTSMAKSLEEKYHENKILKEETQEFSSLIDSLGQSNAKLEDKLSEVEVKKNKLKSKCIQLKSENKLLYDQKENLVRDKDVLWKSCLEYKRETESSNQRCLQYMLERDDINEKYNQLKEEKDAMRVDASKFRDRYNSEREKSIRLLKDRERSSPKLELLQSENEQLRQQLSQLKSTLPTSEAMQGNVQVQMEAKLAILEETLVDMEQQCDESGRRLFDVSQQLHDAEGQKIKMAERLCEAELHVKNLEEEIETYREQREDLGIQLNKIKAERDEAISQRNKAQQECSEKVEERDRLVAEKHSTQTALDQLKYEINRQRHIIERKDRELCDLTGHQTRTSSDSGEFSMDKSFSEDDLLSEISETTDTSLFDYFNGGINKTWKSSMCANVSSSIKRNEPRYVTDETPPEENIPDAVSPDAANLGRSLINDRADPSGAIPKYSQSSFPAPDMSSSGPTSPRTLGKSQSFEGPSSIGAPKICRSYSTPANPSSTLRTPKVFTKSNQYPKREITVPAKFIQDFVEIRGEPLIGFYVICANTSESAYDIKKMDQIMELKCFNQNGQYQSVNFADNMTENQDKVRLMLMCADPDSEMSLTLMYNPVGFNHLHSVLERVKIIENRFFVKSNLSVTGQPNGYLNFEKGTVLMVVHTAYPKIDRTGKFVMDNYRNQVYDWFACKIDKATGGTYESGLIPSNESATKMLEKTKSSFGVKSLMSALPLGYVGRIPKETPYTRIHQYKKLLVIYGPCQLRNDVQSQLQLKNDFQECKLENRMCSTEDLASMVLKHEVLHYVKCGVSNFSVMTTKSVMEMAMNSFCIADIDVQDIETFSSRLCNAGLDVNVVFLRPSTTLPPDTLWNDIYHETEDIKQQMENLKKTEEKLLKGQSYDAIDLGNVEIRTIDDLLSKIVKICNRDPWSKMTLQFLKG